MQESNLKQFETSFHLRHRQLVFKRPGFLGSVAERGGVEYGFNCSSQSAHRAGQGSDTKALEEEEGDEFSWEMGCWKREGWRV